MGIFIVLKYFIYLLFPNMDSNVFIIIFCIANFRIIMGWCGFLFTVRCHKTATLALDFGFQSCQSIRCNLFYDTFKSRRALEKSLIRTNRSLIYLRLSRMTIKRNLRSTKKILRHRYIRLIRLNQLNKD